ncbi:hypothetical protein GOP47_0009488 [Adiantum capillus-veneris]|uniref:Uncharacterized protein n=1 Tax=Adiantum capillus-veneris TaxID=13818 RepID=A0A9D4ZIR7_ADICA|nr:hypothetical protein GOP47_0009488 [Adiantum capillus-veneris]
MRSFHVYAVENQNFYGYEERCFCFFLICASPNMYVSHKRRGDLRGSKVQIRCRRSGMISAVGSPCPTLSRIRDGVIEGDVRFRSSVADRW